MKTDAEKFRDAAKAAYTACTEINATRRKGAHHVNTAGITAEAFKAIAVAFDTCRVIASKAEAKVAAVRAAAEEAAWAKFCNAR